MALEIIHAARRAEMAAVVVHGQAMQGNVNPADIETLCASVMQLSQCMMYVAASLAEGGLTTRFDDSEIMLGAGIMPPGHAREVNRHFRDSFEGSVPQESA